MVFINCTVKLVYMFGRPEAVDDPQTGDPDVLIPAHPLTLIFHGFKGDRSAKSMESIKDGKRIYVTSDRFKHSPCLLSLLISWFPIKFESTSDFKRIVKTTSFELTR